LAETGDSVTHELVATRSRYAANLEGRYGVFDDRFVPGRDALLDESGGLAGTAVAYPAGMFNQRLSRVGVIGVVVVAEVVGERD